MSDVIALAHHRPMYLFGAITLALFALYLTGMDQGHLLSLAQGQVAFDTNLLHEFFHDARHAAGFPCH
jgi:hypothetical protein